MGKLSTLISALLLTSGAMSAAVPDSYEWWFDHDVSSAQSGSVSGSALNLKIDTSGLPKGIHFLNLRLWEGDSIYGAVYRRMFLKTGEYEKPVSYEYWIDDDYHNRTPGDLQNETNAYHIALRDLGSGLHRFSYRAKSIEGQWGTPYTKYFYCAGDDSHFTEYEYWLDDGFANRKRGSSASSSVSFDVDLSDFDRSGGVHYFHLRTRDGDGGWSSVYRKRLVFPTGEMPPAIIGYRHSINGIDLGYVDIDRSEGNTFSFKASLPDRSVIIGGTATSPDQTAANDSVSYVLQLRSEAGWMSPVRWNLDIGTHPTQSIRFSYNGRYLMMESDDPSAEIHYALLGKDPVEEGVYSEPFDVGGLATVNAWAVRTGHQDSERSELTITRYADEEHAETAAEGLLASAFDWDETGLPNNVEEFRIEGKLNEADYGFIRSMYALRHLDLEKVAEARIPEYAFANSKLISVSLPEDITWSGDGFLSNAPHLSSVIWNARSMNVEDGLTRGISNPNLLLYVPAEVAVTNSNGLNIIRDGEAAEITLHYGNPYFAARDFHADKVSLAYEFRQQTKIGVCQGWETIVLPFSPTEITHEVKGPAAPFASRTGASNAKRFWLYRANDDGWNAAPSIEACVPYIISMPCNPEYVPEFNLGGKVTFSAENVNLGPERSYAHADSWIDGTGFEGTFMPVDGGEILSLNVGSTDGGLQPGSTFVPDGVTLPFGAYVSGAGRRAMPIFGGASGVDALPAADDGLLIETPAPGVLRITSGCERNVAVISLTGVTVRTLRLKPGETATLEGLTRDLYIVAGRKAMVR